MEQENKDLVNLTGTDEVDMLSDMAQMINQSQNAQTAMDFLSNRDDTIESHSDEHMASVLGISVDEYNKQIEQDMDDLFKEMMGIDPDTLEPIK